eukprot:PITA_27609
MKIDKYLTNHGFQRSPSDANLYIKHIGDDILFVVVYVDDLIITGSSTHLLHGIKQDLCNTFDMIDLGLHYYLGVEVWQIENNIFLSQSKQLVGSLIYLTTTRPDISFAVSYISRFMSAPKADHWMQQSMCCVILGSGTVTWTCKKQHTVALSSTKAEYRGAVKASYEAVWLRRMLADMNVSQAGPTPLFCDNQGVLKLAKNPVFHERTKHVETHCHYIRLLVEDRSIQLLYVPTTEHPVDIFIKPLGPDKFVKFRGSIGVVNRLSIKGGY